MPGRRVLPPLALLCAWLFAGACNIDLSQQDGAAAADAGADTTADTTADATADAADAADAPAITCSLLQASCTNGQGCYPYPFEANKPTGTQCAFPGTGDMFVPCQSQLECDATSICSNPGDPASVCLARCDLSSRFCEVGNCVPLTSYPGVGACFQM